MDIEATNKAIKVMQAYCDGKTIEARSLSTERIKWIYANNPSWSWIDTEYRVKPEEYNNPHIEEMIENLYDFVKKQNEGKKLQKIVDGNWIDWGDPSRCEAIYETHKFRYVDNVKPEPREWLVYENGYGRIHQYDNTIPVKPIKVREVIE